MFTNMYFGYGIKRLRSVVNKILKLFIQVVVSFNAKVLLKLTILTTAWNDFPGFRQIKLPQNITDS